MEANRSQNMPQPVATTIQSEPTSTKERVLHFVAAVCIGIAVWFAYTWSGLSEIVRPENLDQLRFNIWAPALIIGAMAAAWAFALPASVFLFITPLLFRPHWSALITTAGCALGTTAGYVAARFVGGTWIERFRGGRLHRFLERHSSFMVLFAIRLTPSSPHGFINYGAGLARIPFLRFVIATTLAMALKSYVYAVAVHQTIGAKSLFDALTPRTMASLFAVAVLAFAGHLLHRRYLQTVTENTAAE